MDGSLHGNANNFKRTGLARKAQVTELATPHPGLVSKPQSKLKMFSVVSQRSEEVFMSVENTACRTQRDYQTLCFLLSKGRHEMQPFDLYFGGDVPV